MNNRFKSLYKLEPNLYTKDSPIIISAGVLLKDEKTDSVITQLKFQSVTKKRIIALKITIKPFDVSSNPLKEIVDYQYLDLNINNGDVFGNNKAIVMHDNATRIIKIEKIIVVFENEEQVITGENLQTISNQEKLSNNLSIDLVKQYQIDVSAKSQYVPIIIDNLWMCSCGTPNSTNTCIQCGIKREIVFNSYNSIELNKRFQNRLEYQKEAEEAKKKQENEAKIRQKKKNNLFIAIGLVIVLVLTTVLVTNSIKKKNEYNALLSNVDSYIEQERYEEAFDLINIYDIEFDDYTEYRGTLIPLMQNKHKEARSSSKENFAFSLNDTDFYVDDYEIYSIKDDKKTILYESLGYEKFLGYSHYYTLSERSSIYANGLIIFVEHCKTRNLETYKLSYEYTVKYVNISTHEVKTIASNDSYSDIYKLKNGSIFVGLDIIYPNDGVIFNPYTLDENEGKDVIFDSQLESAIYKN